MAILFTLVATSCERSIDDLYWKANQLVEKKQYAKAISVYDRIIKKRADQEAFFMKAYCYQQDSNYAKALFFFKRLLFMKGVNEEDTSSIRVEMNLNQAFAGHQVTHAEIYYQLGITQYGLDSMAHSYDYFQKAIDRDYEVASCLAWQGLIWTRFKKLEKACPLFEKAIKEGDTDASRLFTEFCSQTGNK